MAAATETPGKDVIETLGRGNAVGRLLARASNFSRLVQADVCHSRHLTKTPAMLKALFLDLDETLCDSLAADIAGAHDSGITSVWIQHQQPLDAELGINPHHTLLHPGEIPALIRELHRN